MKNNIISLAVLFAIMFFASCTKDAANDKIFKATAEPAAENAKVSLSGSRLLWQAGDQISVYDASANAAVYGLASGVGTANAEYTKVSGTTPSATPYTAVYPAAIRTGASTVSLPEVQHTPDGSLTGLPMYAVSDDMELHFYNLCGVVRFRLSASSAVSVSRIAVGTDRNTNGTATISGSGSSVAITTPSGNNVTTLACDVAQSISSARDFYMYLPAGTYSTFRILMTAADGSLCCKSANSSIVVERGKITTITLSGLTFTAHRFSTSSTTSVVFSPGNLQYIGSAATPYWKFAECQYHYIGTSQNGTSSTVDRDLFGWGTSGWDNGNIYYQPWSTAYSMYGDNRYGPVDEYSLTNENGHNYANADWGVYNAIRNGGNAAGLWRTLTSSEWLYLFNSRSETIRCAKAKVNNINGMVLFPDGYSHPAGLSFPSNPNTNQTDYSSNQYSVLDWLQMEATGAVFLPAPGNRLGSWLNNPGFFGNYWSSTYGDASHAWRMNIDGSELMISETRSVGFGVRLVRN